MASSVQLLGSESDLTAATDVGKATLVRVFNTGSAAVLTQRSAEEDVVGTVTLNANEIIYLRKLPAETLEGGASFKVTKVAYFW
jgi:hypothetical protein